MTQAQNNSGREVFRQHTRPDGTTAFISATGETMPESAYFSDNEIQGSFGFFDIGALTWDINPDAETIDLKVKFAGITWGHFHLDADKTSVSIRTPWEPPMSPLGSVKLKIEVTVDWSQRKLILDGKACLKVAIPICHSFDDKTLVHW